jgi:hypothetical protein
MLILKVPNARCPPDIDELLSSPLPSPPPSNDNGNSNKAIPAITQSPRPTSSPQPAAPILRSRLHGPRPIPVEVGGGSEGIVVRPKDIAVLDEVERVVVVIPKGELAEFSRSLPGLKEAGEGVPEASRALW